MNRQSKIKALDAAFKGNLSSLTKVRKQTPQTKINCLVIVNNNTYNIKSIFPKISKYESFLNIDLSESEYKAFLETLILSSEKTNLGARIIELPDNYRLKKSE